VATAPDGNRAYVTYSVTIVERGVGGQSSGSFITDSHGSNWMVTGGYGAVSVIDTNPASATFDTEIAHVVVPLGAQDLALSSDGMRAYVTSWDGKSVTVIDTAENSIVGAFTTDQTAASYRDVSVGINPVTWFTRYVTIGSNGTVYVTDYSDGNLYAVTVDTPMPPPV
jgi:DNA-binding beta-propeller fold protein YncE